jgi:hypothetical protein
MDAYSTPTLTTRTGRLRELVPGLTEGANEETKARYGFVFSDFRRIHRSGMIACQYRAAEWRHKAIELVGHELLQGLDDAAAQRGWAAEAPEPAGPVSRRWASASP